MIREGGFSPRACIGAAFLASAAAQRRHVVKDVPHRHGAPFT
jgi:hypothetical protein